MLASLEVSTRISSVALWDLKLGQALGEKALSPDVESSVTLIPALEALLKEKGLGPENLTALAVAVGPGSFTGIRVGLATAEGICMSSNLPVFGISTLEGLAENLREAGLFGEALCLIDAQRGECFVGHYEIQKDSTIELNPPKILSVGNVCPLIKGKSWVVGPGALKCEKEVRESLGDKANFAPEGLHSPRALSIARLAYGQWVRGKRPTIADLKPLYIRVPSVDEKQKP